MYQLVQYHQRNICDSLSAIDNTTFRTDVWKRKKGGGGTSMTLEGKIFEKAGVNISSVYGTVSEYLRKLIQYPASSFYACGVSAVIHPYSPKIPTTHANFRYFELYDDQNALVDSWFGGGADLTPYYIFEGDCKHFHQTFKKSIDAFDPHFYEDFKQRCDVYFYNKHRGESRGIGGIFYDYMRPDSDKNLEFWFDFQKAMGNAFIQSYIPIVTRRISESFTPKQKTWQEERRGRYVEFNLLHDRGTKFGIETGGRTESILMSLPPTVRWGYEKEPTPNSEEYRLVELLKQPRSWV